MSEIWDDNLRSMSSSGDVYAYAFGVCKGLFSNLEQGHRTPEGATAAFHQLVADVDARLTQLEHQAAALVLADRQHEARVLYMPEAPPVTAIYVSDETAGEQTSE